MKGTRKSNKNEANSTNVKKNLRSAVKKSVNTAKGKTKSTVLVSKINNAKRKKTKRINYSPQHLQNAIKLLDIGISL